jgi:hypothetical protein
LEEGRRRDHQTEEETEGQEVIPAGPKKLPYNGGVPRHWNCRSAELPVTYTWKELGIEGIGETRRVVEAGERASMFGPTTKRTFDSWLRSRSAAEQDNILGSARLGSAFRDGRISSVKDLVSAAGRPFLFRELEDQGLIDPRYAAKRPKWGAFDSPEALRQAIIDEYQNPDSERNKMNARIEQIHGEIYDIGDRLGGQGAYGDLVLTPQERAELKQLRDDLREEMRRLRSEEELYLANKYLMDLTPGRANLRVDLDKGVSHEGSIREAIDTFERLIGSNSHLNRDFQIDRDAGYWEGMEDWKHNPFIPNNFQDGDIRYRFNLDGHDSSKDSHFWGGGANCNIWVAGPDPRDTFHELAHGLEMTSSHIKEKVNEFLANRLGDRWGSEPDGYLFQDWKYQYNRSTTKFIHDYMGAGYGYDSGKPAVTEFVSKGLELFTYNTYEMVRHDPEAFDWFIHMLTGRLDEWKP